MSSHDRSLLHLRVTAEPDSGALARVVERFQNLNIVPQRVLAEWGISGVLHVHVQLSDVSEDVLSLIAVKVAQVPSILNAYWHR